MNVRSSKGDDVIENVQQFFDVLAQHESIPSLSDVDARYEFVIRGAGVWYVALDHGRVAVTGGKARADLRVECDAADFLRMLRGEQNWFTTYLRGAMKLKGDYTTVPHVMTMLDSEAA